jgi:hypothetical protein
MLTQHKEPYAELSIREKITCLAGMTLVASVLHLSTASSRPLQAQRHRTLRLPLRRARKNYPPGPISGSTNSCRGTGKNPL